MIRRMSEQPLEEFDVELREVAVTGAPDAFGESFAALPKAEEFELGEGLEGDPAVAFRRTLGMFATGVTVLTARAGEQVHGMTANAFMSVSLRPPLVLVSVDRRARMCDLLHEGRRFGVNVLEAHQAGLSDRFAGRTHDDEPLPQFDIVHETPLIDGALAHLVARVARSYWGGDHSLFVGHVEYAKYGEGEPLLFHGGRYERLTREQGVPAELLRPILDASGTERSVDDGSEIMRIGEPADSLALVLEGTVRVERPGRSAVLDAGDLIGEIEVLDGGPRIATITAYGPVRLLEVSRPELLIALEREPGAALALVAVLASRFREGA
jgi:flavin reductase (DIM6/NTAB) family NADH-FMN oxidoreductase RutF